MPVIRDVILAKQKNVSTLEPKVEYVSGVTVAVDYEGNARVNGRPGYVWVKENNQDGAIFQCFSPVVKDSSGLPVIIAHKVTRPLRRMVVDIDWDKLPVADMGNPYGIPRHANTHEWPPMAPGSDAMHVYPRSFVALKVYPATPGITIGVAHGSYLYNGNYQIYTGTNSYDISDSVPLTATMRRMVLIYLNPATNDIEVMEGDESTAVIPAKPSMPSIGFPLAYIILMEGMTRVAEANIYEDARAFFTVDVSSDMRTYIVNNIANAFAELDYELTKHVVEG